MQSIVDAAVLRRAFIGATVAWALLLPMAPLAAAEASSVRVWSACVFAVYAIGSLLCHQLPARSFHLWSVPLPVCARCTGIYAGAAIAALASVWFRSVRLQPDPTGTFWRGALIVAALPTAATLVYEWATAETPANWIRALAGLPGGAVVALIVVNACAAAAPRAKVSKVN